MNEETVSAGAEKKEKQYRKKRRRKPHSRHHHGSGDSGGGGGTSGTGGTGSEESGRRGGHGGRSRGGGGTDFSSPTQSPTSSTPSSRDVSPMMAGRRSELSSSAAVTRKHRPKRSGSGDRKKAKAQRCHSETTTLHSNPSPKEGRRAHSKRSHTEKTSPKGRHSADHPKRSSDKTKKRSKGKSSPTMSGKTDSDGVPKTERDFVYYEGDVIPPKCPKFKKKFEDFPLKVREKVEARHFYGLNREDIDEHISHFFTVCRFLLRDCWTAEERRYPYLPVAPPARPFALPAQLELAEALLCDPYKPMKKLFKAQRHAGKGGFGDVHVMKDLAQKKRRDVAVKRLVHNPKTKVNNLTEIFFLSTLQHANICAFHTAFLIAENENTFFQKDNKKRKKEEAILMGQEVWISVEYMEGGTLGEAAKSGSLTEDHVAFTAGEMLKALKYLHERKFVHRDLKSANVMMSVKGEVKLIDFGLCADFSEGPRVKMLGSPFWIPPEMIWGYPHSYPADVWSMGVCLLELLLTHPPYRSSSVRCMFNAATKGLLEEIPDSISAEGKDFLTGALNVDYRKRASVETLLEHPWIQRPQLSKGIVDVLRQIFLSHAMAQIGL
eukprot:TRINITY_DN1689_c1_g2_i1.p1 TRINITY_DN1689_c1_g2~~TRINITY_DN1689_c1_g2_i1.p1  ORF type:complete len:606 (+),score=127.26 TRINITY_DN1689_c1_g2_i1:728-2545(+)